MISQDIETDAPIGVDVRVIDAGGEVDLRWLEGIVRGEVDGQEEDTALEWRVALLLVSGSSPGKVMMVHTGPMMVACQ